MSKYAAFPGMRDWFENLAAHTSNRQALAVCLYELALRDDDAWCGPWPDLTPAQADARRRAALARYRTLVAGFADVDLGRGYKPAERAAQQIRKLTTVRPGLAAPLIDGPDADGRPLRLADFKGRVVVLVFRSFGCSTYRGRLPELKAIAAEYAKKGVTFVGVAGGPTEAETRSSLREDDTPWPNWLDVGSPMRVGPLAERWCTRGGPELFLIDRQGVIRGTAHEYGLTGELDRLLAEPAKK